MALPWRGPEQAGLPASQQYFRSDSSDSAAGMLSSGAGEDPAGEQRRRKGRPPRRRCSPVWLAVGAMGMLALQIASATGLFVYFTMSIAKLKSQAQGTSEELRCLLLLNRLQDLSNGKELVGNQSCFKLAGSIKDYVSQVTEKLVRNSTQTAAGTPEKLTSDRQPTGWPLGGRPSAHLTLRRQSPLRPGAQARFGELQQSCQHPILHWANQTMHAHLQNITYREGQLHISQPGKYYVYAQIYFRYPAEGTSARRTLGHQLVQCVNLQKSYGQSILLLKGVGTKCWAQDAAYGLHALYQGGLFDLKAGDRLFVSVSALDVNYGDEAGSYFGAFRLDG